MIPPIDIDDSTKPPTLKIQLGKVTLREMEVILVQETLRLYQGDKKTTAKALGCSRAALYAKIRRYRLLWGAIQEKTK